MPTCRWAAVGRQAPDPAAGSAGTGSRQSAFAGSDRQGRGRLVDALRRGPLASDDVAVAAGWPEDPERTRRAVRSLVADGLATVDEAGGSLRLP